ncbi:MAG: flagellin [archaeon GB-1867-035]|nr:flagellin [Candidatus Culexmicrobium profundum]
MVRKTRKGMIGIEAAIVLIAFVIVAAAFSFMVINMGMTATQKGRESITSGLQETSSPLTIDGSIMIRETNQYVDAIIIPLKVSGVDYVPMGRNRTVVSFRVGTSAYPNIYIGVDTSNDPADTSYNSLISTITVNSSYPVLAKLFLENNDGDDAFNFYEKGYLIIRIDTSTVSVQSRAEVVIEVRPERSAPLTVEFVVPANLPQGTNVYITVV